MKKILGAAAAAVTIAGLAAAPGLVTAATAAPAKAKVSITIQGPDPEGTVKSARAVCKSGVTVKLIKQIGTRGGGDDVPTGLTDTSETDGGYSFGNPGLSDGKYYAKTRASARCKVGTSPTIVVDRS